MTFPAIVAAATGEPALYHLPGFHEPFSAISHLLGVLAFAWAGALLLRHGRGDRVRVTLLAIYAGSGMVLMAMSGVYHMLVDGGTARAVLRQLDHAAIFVLIAGTFTPLHGLVFRGERFLRWGALAIIWGLAVAGILIQLVAAEMLPEWVELSFFLGLGWLGLGSGLLVLRRHGFGFVAPLAWGGVSYSIGAAADFARWPTLIPGVVNGHELFHVAVLAGAALHYAFVWRVVTQDRRVHGGAGAA